MAKIIKLDYEEVVIADEFKNILKIPYAELDFKPELGDEVDIYPDGETFIVSKVITEQPQTNSAVGNMGNTTFQPQQTPVYVQGGRVINKWAYVLIAFFLGGIGIHKFVTGYVFKGILYVLFCWTGIPALLALITTVVYLLKTPDMNGNVIVTS